MDDNKVSILLDDLLSKFNTFDDGLQSMNEKIDRVEQKVVQPDQKLDAHIGQNRREFEQNRQEHQQLIQMVKELDNEAQVEIKRVK